MHVQGYFGKIQSSYINPYKSLHFVKDEKNHSPSPSSTPPPSKPLKQTQKNISSLLSMETNTPLSFHLRLIFTQETERRGRLRLF